MKLSTLFEDRNLEFEKSLEPYLTGHFGAYTWKRPKDFKPSIPGIAGKLQQAVRYHMRNFNGERWPALEQAFMNRAVTYQGKPGDNIKPRMSLFTYLDNINEPWPEGIEMAKQVVNAFITGSYSRYTGSSLYNMNPAILRFLIKNKIVVPNLIQQIKKIIQYQHDQTKQIDTGFHDEDKFEEGGISIPKNFELMKQYVMTIEPEYQPQ